MSQQDYHRAAAAGGFFPPFSNSFDSSSHQIRKEKLHLPPSLVGFDDNDNGDDDDNNNNQSIGYDSSGVLSEMFNFPPPPLQTDWYGTREAIDTTDSAVAMQLFLMNPNRRSPSPPPAPVSSSTLHMLLPNSSTGGCFGEFTWGAVQEQEITGDHNSCNSNPNELGRLSLSLSSSLEAVKAEELRSMGDSGLLYQNPPHHPQHIYVNLLRTSKYVKAAQELLDEFCSLKINNNNNNNKKSNKSNSNGGNAGGGDSPSKGLPSPALSTADRIEHQRRKAKLLSMLDEVDRRYNHYCKQMQMVVNSFDIVMGYGAAMQYTALAQKAMSRHFRCLKDIILAQLKHSCEMLGEKDDGRGLGITKGETPRLKFLEKSLRQQRTFHQMGMMEQEAWRSQRGLPEHSVNTLRAWLFEHFLNPYPSDADKHLLARQTGLSRNQVSNWFINARVRLWKPMIEEMYEQVDDNDNNNNNNNKNNNNSDGDAETNRQQTPPPPSPAATPPSKLTDHPTKYDPLAVSKNQANPNPKQQRYSSYTAVIEVAPPPSMAALCFPANHCDSDLQDTCRRVGVLAAPDQQFGTTSGSATSDISGPTTLIRFGTTAGDVSLTLGLRHAGAFPDNPPSFSVKSEFGGC